MPEPSKEISLYRPPTEEQQLDQQKERAAYEDSLARSHKTLFTLIPDPNLTHLTENQRTTVVDQHRLELLAASAGSAAMRCETLCPYRQECSYFLAGAQPIGQICPLESVLVREKFVEWMRELNLTLESITASERNAVGELVGYEIELQRVRKTLSRAQNAEMTQLSVRDVNAETGDPICWENTIHTAAQREDQIVLSMRMILKDLELTPEQKTRRARALGIRAGSNMASRQSKLYDKLRGPNSAEAS